MASRLLVTRAAPAFRSHVQSSTAQFSTTRRHLQEAIATPVKKPVGAFRGGLFGFLFGVTLAGASAYYYVIDEYKLANDMLTEDIYSLQAAVQRLSDHVTELENKEVQKVAAR